MVTIEDAAISSTGRIMADLMKGGYGGILYHNIPNVSKRPAYDLPKSICEQMEEIGYKDYEFLEFGKLVNLQASFRKNPSRAKKPYKFLAEFAQKGVIVADVYTQVSEPSAKTKDEIFDIWKALGNMRANAQNYKIFFLMFERPGSMLKEAEEMTQYDNRYPVPGTMAELTNPMVNFVDMRDFADYIPL